MNTVTKIDGFNTRRTGAGTEVQNFSERKRIIDGFVYSDDGAGTLTLKKGDVLAMEVNLGSGFEIQVDGVATNAATYFGYGNMFRPANSARDSDKAFTCGVYIGEEITVAEGEYARISIQVGGILETTDGGCGVASSVAIGDKLICSATVAEAADEDTDVGSLGAVSDHTPFAIALTAAALNADNSTTATAGHTCSVFLLNHLNL